MCGFSHDMWVIGHVSQEVIRYRSPWETSPLLKKWSYMAGCRSDQGVLYLQDCIQQLLSVLSKNSSKLADYNKFIKFASRPSHNEIRYLNYKIMWFVLEVVGLIIIQSFRFSDRKMFWIYFAQGR